ncbi:hypothetical protein ACI4BE_30150, partial [Klebsiella pneumoniae]
NREIEAAINLAKRNSNVIGIVVGNETVFRGEQVPLENLGSVPEVGVPPEESERILREEAQRLHDAETQPEDKRGEAV